jgi:hypothetical protein
MNMFRGRFAKRAIQTAAIVATAVKLYAITHQ